MPSRAAPRQVPSSRAMRRHATPCHATPRNAAPCHAVKNAKKKKKSSCQQKAYPKHIDSKPIRNTKNSSRKNMPGVYVHVELRKGVANVALKTMTSAPPGSDTTKLTLHSGLRKDSLDSLAMRHMLWNALPVKQVLWNALPMKQIAQMCVWS